MNPQLKVEEETGQESQVTMSKGRNTAGGTSDGGTAPQSSVTVSTAGFNPSTIQTLLPLVNSVVKSAAQGVQQAVNQQFAAMLQQQQKMLVALHAEDCGSCPVARARVAHGRDAEHPGLRRS